MVAVAALPRQRRDKSSVPFLKWAGGKARLLPQFEGFFPERIERYIEPFVGSAAVFFSIKEKFGPRKAILSDNNEELINCYRVVRKDVEGLIKKLKEHRRMHSKEYYYKVRSMHPRSALGRAARTIYLNKTCYNGLFRVNSKGEFNVPMGSYQNPSIFDPENLRSVSRRLKGVDIRVRNFEAYLRLAKSGDFFYFDPPYHPISPTSSFTSYTPGAFSEEDQRRLADVYRALDKRGCRLMLSNSDCEFIQELYGDFRLERVRARRAINANGNGRGEINELLVLNY